MYQFSSYIFRICQSSHDGTVARLIDKSIYDERNYLSILYHYTSWAIKTCHFIFHYNSRISLWIFILFAETENNTLQRS